MAPREILHRTYTETYSVDAVVLALREVVRPDDINCQNSLIERREALQPVLQIPTGQLPASCGGASSIFENGGGPKTALPRRLREHQPKRKLGNSPSQSVLNGRDRNSKVCDHDSGDALLGAVSPPQRMGAVGKNGYNLRSNRKIFRFGRVLKPKPWARFHSRTAFRSIPHRRTMAHWERSRRTNSITVS